MPNDSRPVGTQAVSIIRVAGHDRAAREDQLAIEEPLEIRLGFDADGQRHQQSLSITMRTPGADRELAAGFLLSEGIVSRADQLAELRSCGPLVDGFHNVVRVELASGVAVDLARLERHFYTTSSCGVCGKSSLEALEVTGLAPLPEHGLSVSADVIHAAPERLREAQAVFDQTGGLHAAALVDAAGRLIDVREDVGRHNAVDKLIGAALLQGRLPCHDAFLLVSGRASFELAQKALAAGIPMLAAVGAPSSLAVSLARRFGMTLAGFVRQGRFNIYSGEWRIRRHEEITP